MEKKCTKNNSFQNAFWQKKSIFDFLLRGRLCKIKIT